MDTQHDAQCCWLSLGCVIASPAICSAQGRECFVLAFSGLSVQRAAGGTIKHSGGMKSGRVAWQGKGGCFPWVQPLGAAGRAACGIDHHAVSLLGPRRYVAGHEQPVFWCIHYSALENHAS